MDLYTALQAPDARDELVEQLSMGLHGLCRNEKFSADRTWDFDNMVSGCMPAQIFKALEALAAFTLELVRVVVYLYVFGEIVFEFEHLAALGTLEGGFFSVGEHVESEVAFYLECFLWANIALKGPVVAVCLFMLHHGTVLEEGLTTLVTFKRPLTLVHTTHVHLHLARLYERQVTVWTLALPLLGVDVFDVHS